MLQQKQEEILAGQTQDTSDILDNSIMSQRAANAKRKKNAAERIGFVGKR